MKNIYGVGMIRDRGQVTIPEKIRREIDWADPMSPVTILLNDNEIIIKPHNKKVDKKKVMDLVRLVRSAKGSGNESTTDFLVKDRNSH